MHSDLTRGKKKFFHVLQGSEIRNPYQLGGGSNALSALRRTVYFAQQLRVWDFKTVIKVAVLKGIRRHIYLFLVFLAGQIQI